MLKNMTENKDCSDKGYK